MRIALRLEIHFHDKAGEAYVLLSSDGPEPDRKSAEIKLFSCVVAKLLRMLDSEFKNLVPLAVRTLEHVANVGNSFDRASEDALRNIFDDPSVLDFQGIVRPRRFVADFISSEDNVDFELRREGFWFLLKELDNYLVSGIVVLFKYLGRKRFDDRDYLKILSEVAASCLSAYREGTLLQGPEHLVPLLIAESAVRAVQTT